MPTHDRIAYVHMDVKGYHAIVSSTTGECFYVNLKNNQQKTLTRLKVCEGYEICSPNDGGGEGGGFEERKSSRRPLI